VFTIYNYFKPDVIAIHHSVRCLQNRQNMIIGKTIEFLALSLLLVLKNIKKDPEIIFRVHTRFSGINQS
jgi:hypothetical protein